jgi:uncharacterized protein (DUF2237 family)
MPDQLEPFESLNVFGAELEPCSSDPVTGFFRDGCCNSCAEDHGSHTVCTVVTERFLEYSRFRGNDLSTPRPEFGFAGLKEGDSWCLCASRWLEAYEAGMAPKVNLQSTHEKALDIVALDKLKAHAIDLH